MRLPASGRGTSLLARARSLQLAGYVRARPNASRTPLANGPEQGRGGDGGRRSGILLRRGCSGAGDVVSQLSSIANAAQQAFGKRHARQRCG
jgi:hypothetical protein